MTSQDFCGFFEGTEKLLEIWFDKYEDNHNDCDLRNIQRSAWDSLLSFVNCKIISFKSNEQLDAYVLSESSLFVSKNRIIIKTCGSTTLLRCIEPMLYLVKQVAGFDEVVDIFYSRKNFMRPELQDDSHRTFENEVEALDNLFEDGAAFCMGRINSDCWNLYTLNTPIIKSKSFIQSPDQTFEIIMQNLDQKVMQIFSRDVCSSAKEATQKSGIDKILPGMIIDDFLFDPCGYSMNGLIKGGYYVTIHITPEPHCSYVSFETNVPHNSYPDLVNRLLKVFVPGKFLMTICANELSSAYNSHKEFQDIEFQNFYRKELQVCRFKNYEITYGLFAKPNS
ncbi:S-adenosylmethionine decarboxylase proenzyme-like [Oppia nitens]|uniref:S-adenosylmethionine decarboxylase proenzyme-like n=1 Tax=Oppia nitens TaxID=1686743 RepID=UPI0023DB8027|nr:S-adenosylmethionine decarboxylase proenzyme-like [Oppia nitens]